MIATLQIPTSKIRVGDVVRTHGMSVEIDRPLQTRRDGVWFSAGIVRNADEVIEAGQVPESYLDRDGELYRWSIQGNDFATWLVERVVDDEPADDAHLEMAFEDAISGGFDDAMEL